MRLNITCFIFILVSLCLVDFARPVVAATESGSISITAVVEPTKYVFVDDKMRIIKIVSNTTLDAPIVPLSTSSPTQKVSLTPKISQQYTQISKQVNLLKYGQVYPQTQPPAEQQGRAFGALAKMFKLFIMHLTLW